METSNVSYISLEAKSLLMSIIILVKKHILTVEFSDIYYLWYWKVHIKMLSKSLLFCLWDIQWTFAVSMHTAL